MFRLLVLSVPFAIAPLAAVQAVERLLTHSLLPEIATTMQGAARGEVAARPQVRSVPRIGVEGALDPASVMADPELVLKLRF